MRMVFSVDLDNRHQQDKDLLRRAYVTPCWRSICVPTQRPTLRTSVCSAKRRMSTSGRDEAAGDQGELGPPPPRVA